MTDSYQLQVDMNVLTKFFTEQLNAYAPQSRRAAIRQALADAIKRYQEYVGPTAEIKVSTEVFEQLAANAATLLDRFEEEREKKAVPIGGGVYVDVVRDDDYHDLTKGQS